MNHERFNKGMDELKRKYNEAPTTTSPKNIVDAVQKDQKGKLKRRGRKGRSIYWPPVAALFAVLLIGGILIQSSLSSNSELGVEDANDNNFAQEDPLTPGTESNEDEYSDIEKDLPTSHVDRQEVITHTEWPEGMPQDVTYNLFVSETLRLSTYVSRAFDAHLSENENKVAFSAQHIQIEVTMLPPEMASTPADKLISDRKEKLFARGFEEFHESDEDMFENIPHQGFMLHDEEELISYYAILENDITGSIYTFSAEMPIIAQEGTFYPGIQRFIDEMEFY